MRSALIYLASSVSAASRPCWLIRHGNLRTRPGRSHRSTSASHVTGYRTLTLDEIKELPVGQVTASKAHLYLWCPNALLPEGLAVMKAWGFAYKSNIVWHKVRKDGGSDGRGVGFYFRNVTELILFGVKGKNARTLAPGRRQVNLLATRKREHSRKPDEQYEIIEACSSSPYLELFARGTRKGWATWGNQADAGYRPTWKTYAHHSQVYPVAAE
jgi:N6-adenosine-specific RNA methylase IME4